MPPHTPLTPYAQLTPMVVLEALDSVGLPADGRMLQLNSYENRVFQVGLEDGRLGIAKFYRPQRWSNAQILEEHQFSAELVADEIPVMAPWTLNPAASHATEVHGMPPTLAQGCMGGEADNPFRFSVTPCRSGRSPELEDPATMAWIGRFLGRMHRVGSRSNFEHRVSLTPQYLGWDARSWLLTHGQLPLTAEAAWASTTQTALQWVDAAFDRVAPHSLRLHGDCHAGNLLWTAQGPHFVDLDDAMMGPAIQDIWMLLSGDTPTAQLQVQWLLKGYEDFFDFNKAELALIEPLRTLRLIHHSAWLAKRWQDPAFPMAFPWFGEPSYWAQKITELQEQIALMQAPKT